MARSDITSDGMAKDISLSHKLASGGLRHWQNNSRLGPRFCMTVGSGCGPDGLRFIQSVFYRRDAAVTLLESVGKERESQGQGTH